jgi:hypothetical protein
MQSPHPESNAQTTTVSTPSDPRYKTIAARGRTKLSWSVAVGGGEACLSKANLLGQKRQLKYLAALLNAIRDTTITFDTFQDHLEDWVDLRAFEQKLWVLNEQSGSTVQANGAALKVIELVLHPYSEKPQIGTLNEDVWGTPIKGLATMEVCARPRARFSARDGVVARSCVLDACSFRCVVPGDCLTQPSRGYVHRGYVSTDLPPIALPHSSCPRRFSSISHRRG